MLQPIATRAPDFVPDQITDEEGGAMLRAVFNLFGKWEITDRRSVGAARSAGPHIPTLESWPAWAPRPGHESASFQPSWHPKGTPHHLC